MAFAVRPEWLALEPPAEAHALAAPFYTDPGALELERRCVFGRSWQLVAREDALSGRGDHVVADVAGLSLLLVRGGDDRLRALHNVCRHRAGPLALCDGRGAKALHCKYHGWTYTLEGQLRSAPEMQGARDFDPTTIRLPEARVAHWQSLVFAALDAGVPPLDEVMQGIAEAAPDTFGQPLRFHARASYELACNWKVYVDNFLEGYHLPHVHPQLNKMLDYRNYTTTCARWHSLQHSPLEGGDVYGAGGAWYFFIYPNTMLNCMPGRLQTNRVVPLAVDRCRVDFDYWYPDAADAGDAQRRAQDQAFSHDVQGEDAAICEAVQRGLASGSYVAGRLNPKRESGVQHFHDLLREAYRAGTGQAP